MLPMVIFLLQTLLLPVFMLWILGELQNERSKGR